MIIPDRNLFMMLIITRYFFDLYQVLKKCTVYNLDRRDPDDVHQVIYSLGI
jgi:hypothetical protein